MLACCAAGIQPDLLEARFHLGDALTHRRICKYMKSCRCLAFWLPRLGSDQLADRSCLSSIIRFSHEIYRRRQGPYGQLGIGQYHFVCHPFWIPSRVSCESNNLVSYSNGSVTPTNADLESKGLLTYTSWGYLAVNIVSTNVTRRPIHLQWPPLANETDADWAKVGKSALSYAGPWSISADFPTSSETKGVVVHGPLAVCSIPSLDGATMVRNYTISKQKDGRYLNLSFTNYPSRNRADVHWKRME